MKFSKEDRESVTSVAMLCLSIFLLIMTLVIPIKNETFLQSARVFPLVIVSMMLLLSIIYVVTSFRKSGRISMGKIGASVSAFVRSPDVRKIALAVFIVGLYIFFGVAKGRFYICSAVFMLFILLFYVRRLKPWISIIITLAYVGGCYLLFYKLFMVPLI